MDGAHAVTLGDYAAPQDMTAREPTPMYCERCLAGLAEDAEPWVCPNCLTRAEQQAEQRALADEA